MANSKESPFSDDSPKDNIIFTVHKCQPELVAPAIPTPHELKLLSDIDDQDFLRFPPSLIQIYRNESPTVEKDAVEIIREALTKTLVFYYPFAGRLREVYGRKLMVDCTGEGVIFIEADADATLDQFSGSLQLAPFQYSQQFLYDSCSQEITNCPLLVIQVTRLKCNGLILGIRWNHNMSDATGLSQFMNAWAEMARGARKPSIAPVWRRDLLMARDPPRITCHHREFEQVLGTNERTISYDNMLHRPFFFGPTEVAAIRRLVPHHLRNCTTFDVITACLWRCRTKALRIDADEDVSMMCIVNARARFNPRIPVGYYGNVFAYPAAVTTARKLCENPFGHAVEMIKRVKKEVTEEYMHSVADLMVLKGRRMFTRTMRSCIVSDLTSIGLRDVDFGWGKAVSSGMAKGGTGDFPGTTPFYAHKNAKGEEGVVVPLWLPAEAMSRFVKELDDMVGNQNQPPTSGSSFIRSTF
ncbi:benzyl alcohol O-benzoyltransferase [Cajanus cajan]|nr:benzyl alcohol O-benzoyltransferase [Cajanus cajan]